MSVDANQSSQMTVPCPQCQKPVILQQSEAPPFCSMRCQTIDRGAWASDKYFIADTQNLPCQDSTDE